MFWKILIHVIVGIIVAAVAIFAYSTVLPRPAAVIVGVTLGALEIIAPAIARHGISIRALAHAGIPLLVWPIAGVILTYALRQGWVTTMLLASIIAAATGFSTRSHAQGRDTQGRVAETIIAVAIPLYAILAAIVLHAGALDMALAALGGGIGCMVAYQARTWPGRHETALLIGAGACAATAAAWLLAAVVALVA